MNKTKTSKKTVDREQVENVLNDKIADAFDILCKEYGIQMIEWYYPFDADAECSFVDFAKAVASAIEQTMSWYTDDEE